MEVFEELGRGDAALAFSLSMHNAVAAAVAGCEDAGLRARWGADLAAGRALGGFSLTEPHAGLRRNRDHDPGPPLGRRLERHRAQGVGVAGR